MIDQGACPKCGSSDAYTTYQDGTWCFSCHYRQPSRVSGFVLKQIKELAVDPDQRGLTLPDDIGYEYSQECVAWVKQYDLSVEDLIHHKVQWSKKYNQLLFIYDTIYGSRIGCIQGRNFTEGKPKYFNQGDVGDVMPIYQDRKDPTNGLVIVEDAISAIKVSKYVDAMPLLGSYLPVRKILKIKQLGYKQVYIWLDHDKYKEALDISQKLASIGGVSRVIRTDLDPKCYNETFIKDKLE